MKERPILFSGPMVRAILEGWKTQTRRVVKPRRKTGVIASAAAEAGHAIESWGGGARHISSHAECVACLYGQTGDRLWVKETFGIIKAKHSQRWPKGTIAYRADHGITHGGLEYDLMRWKPSIFMRRKYSRITLEIVSVRVERLQDITYKDCEAEGLVHEARAMWSCPGTEEIFREGYLGYRWLWESINGDGSWAKNPWVWVVEFRKLR